MFEFEGGVSDVLERLTGEPGEPFDTTARRYAKLPFARQTSVNRFRAFGKFVATPFLPGYNLNRLDRQWDMPVPPHPSLGIDDAQWRDEHRAMMTQPSVPAHRRNAFDAAGTPSGQPAMSGAVFRTEFPSGTTVALPFRLGVSCCIRRGEWRFATSTVFASYMTTSRSDMLQ